MTQPKYPQIKVKMVGEDGNAFAIIGRVLSAMRKAGISREEFKACQDQMMEGDYNHLLGIVMEWVSVDQEEIDEAIADSEWDQEVEEDDEEDDDEDEGDDDE